MGAISRADPCYFALFPWQFTSATLELRTGQKGALTMLGSEQGKDTQYTSLPRPSFSCAWQYGPSLGECEFLKLDLDLHFVSPTISHIMWRQVFKFFEF